MVLGWLESDSDGHDTNTVEYAFRSVPGIALVRSARIVKASGAADAWRPGMRKNASTVLASWKAELVIAGVVRKSGGVLSLWFIPREGDGTLGRGDGQPYTLEDVTLGQDFHEDLRAELAAIALAAVAPFAENESQGRFLEKGLRDAADKLGTLLAASTIRQPQRRRALRTAHGIALFSLGRTRKWCR